LCYDPLKFNLCFSGLLFTHRLASDPGKWPDLAREEGGRSERERERESERETRERERGEGEREEE